MRRFEILSNRLDGFAKGDIVDEADFPGGEIGWLENTGMVREVEAKPDRSGSKPDDNKRGNTDAG